MAMRIAIIDVVELRDESWNVANAVAVAVVKGANEDFVAGRPVRPCGRRLLRYCRRAAHEQDGGELCYRQSAARRGAHHGATVMRRTPLATANVAVRRAGS